MHGGGDAGNGVVGQLGLHAADHATQLARVDEQYFALARGFAFGQEPQAGGDLGVEEQLAGQRDHHFHHVGLYHGAADIAFAVLARGHAAVGQHDAGAAAGLEVVQHVLQPGVVGVAGGRGAVHPARVAFQAAVPPVADVERRVGQDEVSAQVGVLVLDEGVGRFAAQVEVDAANGQVHRGQAPGGGVGFLAVDGHVAQLAAVRFDEFFRLHKHAAGAAARVVHLALVRVQHGDQRVDDGLRGVELAAFFAFGAGELAEEVFVHLAQDVAGDGLVFAKADGGHQVHQLAQLAVRQRGAGVAFVEDAFQARVFLLDDGQRVVDAFADVGLLGGGAQAFPAGGFRHPEHVHFAVVVALFQLFGQQLGVAVVQEVVVSFVGKAAGELVAPRLKGVGYEFEENQPQHDVLIFGGVHIGAQLVGGGPQGFLDVV